MISAPTMHRALFCTFLFAAIALQLTPVAQARTFHVSTSGSDSSGDGSAGSPWRTPSHAAAQALDPGDRVLIEPGTYAGDLVLTRSGAAVVPVTPEVAVADTDKIRFPAGTDLSGLDLASHPGEYYLYVYRSWRANNGVFQVLATGADALGPWVQVAGADFMPETGAAGDATRLSAAIGQPIVFSNASTDPATQRVLLDASSDSGIYTVLYIGDYLAPNDANPVDWNLVDGIDLTGSRNGGGMHIQDSSFNVFMNGRVYDLHGAGILVAGSQDDPARYNMIWNNLIYNTPDEGVYVGAGGHGPSANHAYYTHVIDNDISTQGSAANAVMENAIDLKEHNFGDLVAGNLIHDYDLMSPYNGAIDIRNGKRDVLVYNNVLRDIGKDNNDVSSVIHLYAGSDDVVIFNNLLYDTRPGGSPVYAFNVDGGGSERVLIAHNSVSGLNDGILLEHYGGAIDIRFIGNCFDVGGGIEEWGNTGRFRFDDNLYTADPGAYAGESGRLIADPQWVDPTAGDFRLQPTSPAVDSSATLAEVTIDLDRAERPSGGSHDRGAYELVAGPQPPAADFAATPISGGAPLTVGFEDRSDFEPTGWSWDFGDGGTSGDQHPTHVYTEVGRYSITLTVDNAQGNDSLTRTDLISVQPAGSPTAFFGDGYETTLDWQQSGDVLRSTDDPKIGSYAVRLRKTGQIQRSIPTSGYDYIRVAVQMGAHSLDKAGETLEAWWFDGATWNLLARIADGDPEEDKQLHPYQLDLPASAANNPAFALRFQLEGSGTGDYGYLDEVRILGWPNGDPTPPTAGFSASPTSGEIPLAVQFDDQSSGATAWSWDFGDGTTSGESEPSHVYAVAGNYTVIQTVSNAAGSAGLTRVHYIHANPALVAPAADFDATPLTGSAPLRVQFTDLSSGAPTAWSWEFGDGSNSSAQHPVHDYAEPGTYSVTLTVTNAAGSDSLTRAELILAAPPSAHEALLSDDFETGLESWYLDGSVSWYEGEPRRGTHAMRLTGNNIWAERMASTLGYEQIRIAFWVAVESFENWEYLILYWHDGQTWHEPIEVTNQHPAAGSTLTLVEVDLPAAADDNPDFGIAFGMWDTDTADFAYIDDVLVSGVPTNPAPPAAPTGALGGMDLNGAWATQSLTTDLIDPVIITGPPTANDPEPGVVRLRNVGSSGFEARFEEWNYLDRLHANEQAAWLALEPGRYQLTDGGVWEVGRFELDGTRSWSGQSFMAPFSGVPELFLTAQTANGGQTVTARAKGITASGFSAALYEQESLNDGHSAETIGYLAIYQPAGQGIIDLDGLSRAYRVQSIDVGSDWVAVDGIELRVEEEQSRDVETNHLAETLSVLDLDGRSFAQDVSTAGGNPAAVRMR